MRLPFSSLSALCLLLCPLAVTALQVAPGSPCARACLGSPADNNWSASASNTNSSEITCSDAAYSSTTVGIKFKKCLECLRTSSRGNMDETDAKWFVCKSARCPPFAHPHQLILTFDQTTYASPLILASLRHQRLPVMPFRRDALPTRPACVSSRLSPAMIWSPRKSRRGITALPTMALLWVLTVILVCNVSGIQRTRPTWPTVRTPLSSLSRLFKRASC